MAKLSNTSQIIKDKMALIELLDAKETYLKYHKLESMFPKAGIYSQFLYPKQMAFFAAGKEHSQRLLMGGNRTGKTIAGGTETAYHLTGCYPDWWEGHRFLNPISAWAVGVTNQSTKRVLQRALLGSNNDLGSGLIPKDKIVGNPVKKAGVSGAYETVYVKHASGGISELTFLSYEQGRDSFQGTYIPWIWMDEEPRDYGIYEECLMRTMNDVIPGHIICTFTPLFGRTDMVLSFLEDGRFPPNGVPQDDTTKFVTQIAWSEIPHLSEDQKEALIKSIAPHLRDARTKGIPSLGAGAIYPYPEDMIVVEPFPIPSYWPKAYGMDVGWNRTAAAWITMNPETNQYYLYAEHYAAEAVPAVHAASIKAKGKWIRGAIDPAAKDRNPSDGKQLLIEYNNEDLLLELADNAVEAGIQRVSQLLLTGQLKIFNTCFNWLSEYRSYTRDEKGKIVKRNDHLMDATRYGLMGCPYLLTTPPDSLAEIRDNFNSSYRDTHTGY